MQDAKYLLMRYGDLRRQVDHFRRVLDDVKQRRMEEFAGASVPIPDIGTRVQSGKNSDPTYTITERLIMYHDERVSKAIENYNWGSTLSFVVVVIIAVFLLQDQSMKAHDLKRLEKMQTESEKNVS